MEPADDPRPALGDPLVSVRGMWRWFLLCVLAVAGLFASGLAVVFSAWWWPLAVIILALTVLGGYDMFQHQHSVLRNYPILGHLRYLMETIRPELQQYFIERNHDGRPFNRDVRTTVYERAKGTKDNDPFGTELNVEAAGYEHFVHSIVPRAVPAEPPRTMVGGHGPDQRSYAMSLLNVSAMSFGSLSANAILALNKGATLGGFAQDTGEGGISDHHLRHGGDLIWEIGTGYFGCRTPDGDFDADEFARKAADSQVKCVSLKLSQGAKPGLGGVLPGGKVDAEIARVRSVEIGTTVISPSYHRVFSTPRELVRFIGRFRELAGGKPAGFKLCVGSRREILAVCKAMLDEDITPDFIVVDGAEGGTGAAPLEFVNHVGTPLTEGLHIVHNALVGAGLRDRIKIGASGKVATGSDIVKRLIQGADYTNAARAMMFAVGCIQAQRCHTNTCPVGVATQDPKRTRALVVPDKAARVQRFHATTVHSALQIMASLGADGPADLHPGMLRKRVDPHTMHSYAELYPYLEPGALLDTGTSSVPQDWMRDWKAADPDTFLS